MYSGWSPLVIHVKHSSIFLNKKKHIDRKLERSTYSLLHPMKNYQQNKINAKAWVLN